MREHALVATLAITFSIIDASWVVYEGALRVRFLAFALQVELAYPLWIGG